MEDNNNQINKQDEASKPNVDATTVETSSWKRLLAKKWVFPAMYLAAAAIILSLMWAYQGSDTNVLTDQDMGLAVGEEIFPNEPLFDDALPVTATSESMKWPVEDFSTIEVAMPYFDSESSSEAKQAAMIEYGDQFIPNVGISLSRQDNETFDVLAALSGTVTRVETPPLLGNLVEITHEDGLKTIYFSLDEVVVTENAVVDQGEKIAQAGRNELQKDLGVHLHFEVQHDGEPVNPEDYIAN